MKNNHIILFLSFIFMMGFIACNKNEKYYPGNWDPKKIRGYNNENYYTSGKMDSIEAIFHITEQKLQEVYDLAVLASENQTNKEIDTLLLSQIQGYFPKGDTLYAAKVVHSLDSLKAKYVKIELEKQNINDSIILNDSIGILKFKAHFYDNKKRFFSTQKRQVEYILKKNPEKFKTEFKFYFSSIGNPEK